MRARVMTTIFFFLLFLVIDYYVFQAIIIVSKNWQDPWRSIFRIGFWIPSVLSIAALGWWTFGDLDKASPGFKNWLLTGMVATYFSKVFAVAILFVEDITRGVRWLASLFQKETTESLPGEAITRSEFLSKTALVAAAVPFGTMAYGIISGAHDYRIRRHTIALKNLPRTMDGITIAQLSDIHSGSFFNKTAVRGGVDMVLKEKPDIIFFTGDLVNNQASEVREYIDVFDKLKAPLGVHSVTGNHDYGDYFRWPSLEAKRKNFKDLIEAHRIMGFNLLMNDHAMIEVDGESIAVLGIENWGERGFAKYGKLDLAYQGTNEAPVKILLSHDPSHWDGQVRPDFPDIDLMLAGHTHGFQFGVEVGNFKWSPSQYAYKQWAGLYNEGSQYLYVNRGFGYIGYPGRIGMPPEITILTLKRA